MPAFSPSTASRAIPVGPCPRDREQSVRRLYIRFFFAHDNKVIPTAWTVKPPPACWRLPCLSDDVGHVSLRPVVTRLTDSPVFRVTLLSSNDYGKILALLPRCRSRRRRMSTTVLVTWAAPMIHRGSRSRHRRRPPPAKICRHRPAHVRGGQPRSLPGRRHGICPLHRPHPQRCAPHRWCRIRAS